MNNEMMKLPASCTAMTADEMTYTCGGSAAEAAETAVKAVVAIGVSAALTGVAAFAAVQILNIFNPKAWENAGTACKNWWDSITAKG